MNDLISLDRSQANLDGVQFIFCNNMLISKWVTALYIYYHNHTRRNALHIIRTNILAMFCLL